MLEELLSKQEGKTLEFKENTQSLHRIIQTIIAFSNTAGGVLIIGVKDKTKEVVGISNISKEEEKISSALADSVRPLLLPTFHFYTWRGKDVLIIVVSHSVAPYYLLSAGLEKGVYMRLGSTNRIADAQTIIEIKRLKEYKSFDAEPNYSCPIDKIQFDLVEKLFKEVSKKFTAQTAQSLHFVTKYHDKKFPTNAAVLLFAQKPTDYLPDARIRLARFLGVDKSEILDMQDLEIPLAIALDPIVQFIRRHTSTAAEFGALKRKDIPQYPAAVVREAVINALLHTDYSLTGASITIGIFTDRIEITNPGALPFGLSLEEALAGVSLLRNRAIGTIFRELLLIERWGSGLGRMIAACEQDGIKPPKFEEIGSFFRVTLYPAFTMHPHKKIKQSWQELMITYLREHKHITSQQAQKLWNVTQRTTSTRLKNMCKEGVLIELSTSPYDPHKKFRLSH